MAREIKFNYLKLPIFSKTIATHNNVYTLSPPQKKEGVKKSTAKGGANYHKSTKQMIFNAPKQTCAYICIVLISLEGHHQRNSLKISTIFNVLRQTKRQDLKTSTPQRPTIIFEQARCMDHLIIFISSLPYLFCAHLNSHN